MENYFFSIEIRDLNFDYDRYYKDLGDQTIDVPEYVTDDYIYKMLQRARSSESFSLRKFIKPTVLRNYVSNYYSVGKNSAAIEYADVVLVVDDFGTTGSTIREIVRNIRTINPICEIYIFTLMGNRRTK